MGLKGIIRRYDPNVSYVPDSNHLLALSGEEYLGPLLEDFLSKAKGLRAFIRKGTRITIWEEVCKELGIPGKIMLPEVATTRWITAFAVIHFFIKREAVIRKFIDKMTCAEQVGYRRFMNSYEFFYVTRVLYHIVLCYNNLSIQLQSNEDRRELQWVLKVAKILILNIIISSL